MKIIAFVVHEKLQHLMEIKNSKDPPTQANYLEYAQSIFGDKGHVLLRVDKGLTELAKAEIVVSVVKASNDRMNIVTHIPKSYFPLAKNGEFDGLLVPLAILRVCDRYFGLSE